MLGIVAAMLTAFASFFIYLIRRARQVAAQEQADLRSQEGTAQC